MGKKNLKKYDPAFKARVALEAVKEHESLAQIGQRQGVHGEPDEFRGIGFCEGRMTAAAVITALFLASTPKEGDQEAFLAVLGEIDTELEAATRGVSALRAACANLDKASVDSRDELLGRLATLFPGVIVEAPKACEAKNEAQVFGLLRTAQKSLPQLRNCARKGAWLKDPVCKKFVGETCRAFSSTGDGQLLFLDLSEDATVSSRVVQEPDEVIDEAVPEGAARSWELLGRKVFYGCRLAAAERSLSTKQFARFPRTDRWMELPFPFDLETMETACAGADLTYRTRVEGLHREYGDAFPVDSWYARMTRNTASCVRVASELCKNVRSVRGVGVLDYVTRACEVRSVTENDIKGDIERWAGSRNVTEADRIEHLVFADTIRACGAVERAGIYWLHEYPRVSADCKPLK